MPRAGSGASIPSPSQPHCSLSPSLSLSDSHPAAARRGAQQRIPIKLNYSGVRNASPRHLSSFMHLVLRRRQIAWPSIRKGGGAHSKAYRAGERAAWHHCEQPQHVAMLSPVSIGNRLVCPLPGNAFLPPPICTAHTAAVGRQLWPRGSPDPTATCQSSIRALSGPALHLGPFRSQEGTLCCAGRRRERLHHPELPIGRAAKRRLPAPPTIGKGKEDPSGLLCVSVKAKWHFFRLFVGTEMPYKLIMSFTVRQEAIFSNLR